MDKSKIEKLEVLMKYVTSKSRGYYKGQIICKGEPDFDYFIKNSIIAMPGEENKRARFLAHLEEVKPEVKEEKPAPVKKRASRRKPKEADAKEAPKVEEAKDEHVEADRGLE